MPGVVFSVDALKKLNNKIAVFFEGVCMCFAFGMGHPG